MKVAIAVAYTPSQQCSFIYNGSVESDVNRVLTFHMDLEQSTRVALLYQGRSRRRKIQHIVNHIADETIAVNLDSASESLCEAVADCDLILIDCAARTNMRQRQMLKWIRVGSLAPVVVLVTDDPAEQAFDAIAAGADAVISLHLSSSVIVAHCKALMRRWRSHPYASPKFA